MIGKLHTAALMLGGNKGEVVDTFRKAINLLVPEYGKIITQSSVYRTEPWGKTDQPFFLNQVYLVQTSLSPGQLMERTREIENRLGRMPANEPNGPRIIDIDILFFDSMIIDEPGLTIPHPRMHLRRFNLVPLAEILPEWRHPVLMQTTTELLANCPDTLSVFREI